MPDMANPRYAVSVNGSTVTLTVDGDKVVLHCDTAGLFVTDNFFNDVTVQVLPRKETGESA